MRLLCVLSAICVLICASGEAGVIVQEPGANYIVVEAEDVDSVLNPDAANDVRNSVETGSPESPPRVFTVVSDSAASGGQSLRAPSSPHKQQNDPSKQESVAVYRLEFATPGTYRFYARTRNNGTPGSTSTNSIWQADSFGAVDPSVHLDTGTSGDYTWRTEYQGAFDVLASDVGTPLEYRIGVREVDARVDMIVFSLVPDLDAATLDTFVTVPEPGATVVATPSELVAAVSAAAPGDEIVIANGTWTDASITLSHGGTASSPITVRAETPGEVILTGGSRIRLNDDYIVLDGLVFRNGYLDNDAGVLSFNASWCRATNCAIIDYSRPDTTVKDNWITVHGFHNRVDHCYLSGKTDLGVMVKVEVDNTPGYNVFDHNYFGDRPEGDGNGFEIFRIGTSTVSARNSSTTLEYNYFYHCNGESEVVSNKSAHNIYRHNTFDECKGSLVIRHGKSATVDGNFFLGNGVNSTGGIRLDDAYHTVTNNYLENLGGTGGRSALVLESGAEELINAGHVRVRDSLIAHNTFINCASNISIGNYHTADIPDGILTPENNTIANNIVLADTGSALVTIIEDFGPPRNFSWEGNIMFGAPLGIDPMPGIETVDPVLALAGDGLWRPQTGSPAIDGALGSYPEVTTDMDGQPRVDGSPDTGADERSTAALAAIPLTANDVGPDWMRTDDLRGDSDGDGLPDDWETDNGLDPTQSTGLNGPDGDPDHDGSTNFDEFIENRLPNESDSDVEHTPVAGALGLSLLLAACAFGGFLLLRKNNPVSSERS